MKRAVVWWLVVLAINAVTIGSGVLFALSWSYDWNVFEQLPWRLASGALYAHGPGYNFVWAPPAAWLIGFVVLPLGSHIWFVLHAVPLAFLRDRLLIACAVCSIPLWIDAGLGNTMAFVFLSGALALRGSRYGELAFLVLFALAPRPVALPLVAWLLVRQPHTRVPFVAMTAGVLGSAVASGYAPAWLGSIASTTASHAAGIANIGPTGWFGLIWLVVGVPVAAWLTTRGRVGLAGLLITPYLFPQYLLVALWDLVERQPIASAQSSARPRPYAVPQVSPTAATLARPSSE